MDPHSDEAALLTAVHASRGDATPRLVYADEPIKKPCRVCRTLYVPSVGSLRHASYICKPCNRTVQSEWRQKRGIKIKATMTRCRTPGYTTWMGMLARCYHSHVAAYPYYGGRGITVCDRWRESFENFISDMGEKPGPGYSLDRINNDGPYSLENCRWASKKSQARNRRSSHSVTCFGATRTIAEWAEVTGLAASMISLRLVRLKWTPEKALTTPSRRATTNA